MLFDGLCVCVAVLLFNSFLLSNQNHLIVILRSVLLRFGTTRYLLTYAFTARYVEQKMYIADKICPLDPIL